MMKRQIIAVLALCLTCVCLNEAEAAKICIDPGHGGSDPGAVGCGLREASINLEVSLKLRDMLTAAGHQVFMTRTTDTFIDLAPRASYANSQGVATFASIHTNSAGPTATGIEVFTYTGASGGASGTQARNILNRMLEVWPLRNRGVKEANYAVLRLTSMYATLSELAFIVNCSVDAQYLGSEAHRTNAARAHCRALVAQWGGNAAACEPVVCNPSLEICDGKDNDCNGQTDEGDVCEGELTARLHAIRFDRIHSDIDGDGKMDYCARSSFGFHCHLSSKGDLSTEEIVIPLSNENGWSAEHYYQTIHMADINGDDKADVCARGGAGLDCWLSRGTTLEYAFRVNDFTDSGGWTQTRYYSTLRFADINGDGKDDVCARWGSDYGCLPSTGTGFGARIGLGDWGDAKGWEYPRYYGTIQPADINGDGKYDICARGSGGISCFISQGTSFGPVVNGPAWSDANGWGNMQYWATIQFADINGDGKDDVCGRDSAGVICHLSTGTGFGQAIRATDWADASGWADPSNYMTIQFADINGDGKQDVCGKADVAVGCRLSEGEQFGASVAGPPLNDNVKWNEPNHYRSIRYGDYNGDYKADLCARDVDGVVCYPSSGTDFGAAQRGAGWADAHGWANGQHAYTFRFAGLKPCVPQCNGKNCGIDGCGASCGSCKADETCTAGVCKANCKPDCSNKQCGPDGCGASCGSCDPGVACSNGVCSTSCTPDCSNKQCGPDGCGSSCGSCEQGEFCSAGICATECVANCQNKVCGSDNCGGSCGTCPSDEGCVKGLCVSDCTPSTEVCDDKDNNCDGFIDEGAVCDHCPFGKNEQGLCLPESPVDPTVCVESDDCSCQINVNQNSAPRSGYIVALLLLVIGLAVRRRRSVLS